MSSNILRDGPYILGNTIRYITDQGEIKDFPMDRNRPWTVHVPNKDQDQFEIHLKSQIIPEPEEFTMPDKLVAISDIEGNFNGLASFMIHNKIVDQEFNWIFNEGHFLINGDLVDRGPYPMAILWLMYKLESQAEDQGGRVHINLGNHDIMNIQGWRDYANPDYQKNVCAVTERLEGDQAFRFLHSNVSEIGKWLRSKNTVIKIGNLLFVHGGLSYQLLPYKLSLQDINKIVRKNIDQDFYFGSSNSELINTVMGRKGPIWYRTLAREHEGRPMDSQKQLESVLQYYDVEKMVIGHTVVPDICTDYHGKLVKIDVLHGQQKYTGETRGILVQDHQIFTIDDVGERKNLF
ncbi:MAG: metallophosphoesterase [Saprospiraceae bacterium]|nr:metallophosphoesterase [Saprospiraceae bacterium]